MDVGYYLPENIKNLRRRNGMTQVELAELLGVENTTVSNYESGYSRPSQQIVTKLAEIFKCSIDDLLLKPLKLWNLRDSGSAYPSFVKNVPVYPTIEAVREIIPLIITYVTVVACSATEGRLVGVMMPDNSLNRRGIKKDDIIVVKCRETAEDGDVAVVFSGESCSIGIYCDEGEGIISISPDSTEDTYEKQYFNLNDEANEITGVVLSGNYIVGL